MDGFDENWGSQLHNMVERKSTHLHGLGRWKSRTICDRKLRYVQVTSTISNARSRHEKLLFLFKQESLA
jgi:hypothetical protein